MYDPYSEFSKTILSNGLEIHSVFWDRPWVGVEIIVHSGGREDPIKLPGLAHFVEHLVSQNIPNHDFNQVKDFFDECGGRTAFGSTDYLSTKYEFGVPADIVTFRKAINIFGSMLVETQIEKDIDRERKVIFREFNERYPFLDKLEWDMEINESLFKGHRLETWNRPLGRPEGFLSATKDDLQSFYGTHYVPANITLVIVGGIHKKELITEIKKSPFGIKKGGKRNPLREPLKQFPIPAKNSRTVKLSDHVSFKVNQAEYRAIWAFPADFDHQARRVFDSMLEKILFEEIREKRGFVYGIRVRHSDYQDVSRYNIHGMIKPDVIWQIDELVHKCIKMVPSNRTLFDRMVHSLKQRCLMTDLSGYSLVGNSAEDLTFFHRIIPLKEDWDDLHKVRLEQMAEVVSLLSPNQQYTFITCP